MSETSTNSPAKFEVASPTAWRFSLRTLLVLMVVIAAPLALWVGPVRRARDVAKQMSNKNNVKQITLALQNYHDANNHLPPAVVRDAQGVPICSARVLLSAYLEASPFYGLYDRTRPWNSPGNDALARDNNFAWSVFGRRNDAHNRDEYCANFIFVTGPGTLFPDDALCKFEDVTDGADQTIAVVEIDRSDIAWHEPRDLRIDQMSFRINDPDRSKSCIGNRYHRGAIVGMLDGSVHFLPQDTPPETLKAMLTIAGGEKIPDLDRP